MNYTLDKHPEHNFFRLCISGNVLPGDLIKMLQELWQNDCYLSQPSVLWDFSQSETNYYFEDIFKLFQFVKENKQNRGPSTLAVYAPHDTEFGMSRMYAMLSETSNPKVMVFRDVGAAESWLLENTLVRTEF